MNRDGTLWSPKINNANGPAKKEFLACKFTKGFTNLYKRRKRTAFIRRVQAEDLIP